MEDVGTSKPIKCANKVGRLMQDPKLNKPYMEVVCLILGPMLTSCVSTIHCLHTF